MTIRKHKTNIHPEDLKARIRKSGVSVSEVGRRAGISGTTTVHALHRRQPLGNRAIADYLKEDVHTLWPEWFHSDGSPKRSPSNHTKLNRGKTKCHRQKRMAA